MYRRPLVTTLWGSYEGARTLPALAYINFPTVMYPLRQIIHTNDEILSLPTVAIADSIAPRRVHSQKRTYTVV